MTTQNPWSINRLAAELNMDRRKLSADLEGCKPVEEKKVGSRVERRYRLGDAVRHLIGRNAASTGTDGPDRLDRAQEQARLWKTQRLTKELDNAERERKLVPVGEVEAEFAFLVKTFTGFLEQLPDVLERDANISGAAVERLQQIVDRERERLYQAMVNRADSGTGTTTP